MARQTPYVIKLSAADRAVLEKRSRTYTARYADVIRAKIVLMSADGYQNTTIAERLDVHVNMVREWRKRFFESGLVGLEDRPRPGRPPSSPTEVVAEGAAPREQEAPSRWNSTEPAARAVAEGLVTPLTGPAVMSEADRARGRSSRRSLRPRSAPAATGELIAFEPRHNTAATRDALRRLASSIDRYLAEVDAEPARTGHARTRQRRKSRR